MRFRTKLLVVFLTVALVSNALAIAVMYSLSKRFLFDQFRSKVLSVSATTAALVDADLHGAIHTRADEGSPAYLKLREQLRRARDANRRSDIYVKYLVTFKPAGQGGDIEFGVDPEESARDVSHVGDVYRSLKGRPIHLGVPEVDARVNEDEWGKWIGANVPVKDSAGKVVGAVATDVSSAELDAVLRPLQLSALGCLGLGALLALGATLVISDRVSRPVRELQDAVGRVGQGDFDARVDNASRDEFGDLGRAVNAMALGLRERDNVKSAFAHYVSRQVFDSITTGGQAPALYGDRRKITVLFCDVCGFTRMSEKMRPEAVVEMLNQYFEKVVDIVVRNHGIIDKFLGDGVMVIFGAPQEDPYQEENALKAALEIRAGLLALRSLREKQGLPSVSVGIGINSGVAVVGNIGTSARMEYTAIGDTVNLASRLEAATRELGVDILISEYTYNALRGSCKMNKVGPVSMKGRDEPIVSYTIETDGAFFGAAAS